MKTPMETEAPQLKRVAAALSETNCERMKRLGEIAREKKLPTTITVEEFVKRND
jgi:hypothetical protein